MNAAEKCISAKSHFNLHTQISLKHSNVLMKLDLQDESHPSNILVRATTSRFSISNAISNSISVLSNMLSKSNINPFDSQEAKPYKNDPEIIAMTRLRYDFYKRVISTMDFQGGIPK